jgi:chemotaxis regulatin CheY-phosphate phosphatase CheZ
MPGRGGVSAKRRPGRRTPVKDLEVGSTVAEEVAVLVNTLRELAAIRATAEDAAGRILDSAENLLAFADKEEAEKAQEAIFAIMTACGFHDLVGQRVTKIAESLDRVLASKRAAGGKPVGPCARRKALDLEGPAMAGVSDDVQARIDALFRDN